MRLACLRHLNDLRAARKADFPYFFDEAKARRACMFIERLPHTKGKWMRATPGHDNLLHLEPWQLFILCSIFGWLNRKTGFRRFRYAYICVPRKNGKSALASGIGNYMFAADGELGAEVYSGATTEYQAWEVFRPARLQMERTEWLAERFGVEVNAKSLIIPANGSRFLPVIGKPGDGASPSCAIIDEYHEHDDDTLYDTMVTGMLAREQPLALVITTAGTNLAGPCRAMEENLQKVLEGTTQDDQSFAIIYGIDENDDWTTQASLRKANPNFGVSIIPEILLSEHRKAAQDSRKQNIFKTKHLNIWCNAKIAWMNMQRWHQMADAGLREEDFAGCDCVIAGDFSTKIDLTALVKVFRRQEADGKDHFYAFPKFYLPEDRALDPEKQHYQGWLHDGLLTGTDGAAIDFFAIKDDIVAEVEKFKVREFGYDGWQAEMLVQGVAAESFVTTVQLPNTVKYLSDPMKWLEALVLDRRLHHPGHKILDWCISNVVAKVDKKDEIFPNKERAENKIDGAVALIMALSRSMVGESSSGSYYFEPFTL